MPQQFNLEFWTHLEELVKNSKIVIDRPKDSAHPQYDDMIYPVDYGYLAGTISSDGAGIDVWIGKSEEKSPVAVICTVDLIKRDMEMKILLGCSEKEINAIVTFLNQGENLRGLLLRRE